MLITRTRNTTHSTTHATKPCILLALLLAATTTAAFAAKSKQQASPLPKNPAALLALAAQHNGLASPNLKPWHIQVTYQLYDTKGKPTEKGTFNEWWAAPHKYKFSFKRAGKTATLYMTPKGSYQSENVSPGETALKHWMVEPLPENFSSRHNHLKRSTEVFDQMKFDCVENEYAEQNGPTEGGWSLYCLSTKLPILRIFKNQFGVGILYRSIAQLQGQYLGNDLAISQNGVPVVTAHLISGQVLTHPDQSLFALPPEAKGHLQPVYKTPDGLPAVVPGHRISGRGPQYPAAAKMRDQQGTVTLEASIGKDGKIHHLKVISSPSPDFSDSALDAVKTWRYKPYTRGGHPIQVETIIHVVYRIRR